MDNIPLSRKVPKFILLAIISLTSLFSVFFIAVEVFNIISNHFFLFLHPFNGLLRYFSRIITFLFIFLTCFLAIINIFKSTPVKTRVLSVALIGDFILSFSFLAYLDLFVFLIFNIFILVSLLLHYYIYWYIPNRKAIKKLLTKNNNQ